MSCESTCSSVASGAASRRGVPPRRCSITSRSSRATSTRQGVAKRPRAAAASPWFASGTMSVLPTFAAPRTKLVIPFV